MLNFGLNVRLVTLFSAYVFLPLKVFVTVKINP